MMIPPWVGNVSHETQDRLTRYVALLLKWNAAINLIGKTTEVDLWQRHVWDSYQILPLIPESTQTLADLGSGGGLPGLVIACARPDMKITLVERDQRKCSFLREAARSIGLQNVTVRAEDARDLTETFDVVTSRALASLVELCAFAHPLLGEGGICLFPKGENFARELEEAQKSWMFDSRVIHSKTNEKAGIISLSELKPATDGKQQ